MNIYFKYGRGDDAVGVTITKELNLVEEYIATSDDLDCDFVGDPGSYVICSGFVERYPIKQYSFAEMLEEVFLLLIDGEDERK